MNKAITKPVSIPGTADYRIALSTLESEIIKGETPEKYRQFLNNTANWINMTAGQKIRWARLAQLAGEMNTALAVLDDVNKKHPGHSGAWKDHVSLLMILEKRKKAAEILSSAAPHIAEKIHDKLAGQIESAARILDPDDLQAVNGPFDRLRIRQQRIERFMALFSGRDGCFARQWVKRDEGRQGYVPVHKPFCEKDAEDHLNSRRTYGMYLLKENNTVALGVIDADATADFRKSKIPAQMKRTFQREKKFMIKRIKTLSEAAGLFPLIEFSGGKGFHFWFFFKAPIPAACARQLLIRLKAGIAPDLSAFSLEVFPKQDRLGGKGFGNLVKLPLGTHRLSGKKSYFPECSDRSIEAQLDFLSSVKTTDVKSLSFDEDPSGRQKLLMHPRWEHLSQKYPELACLEMKCPPLGQILSFCRSGSSLAQREERILIQTIGFLPKAKKLLHYLFSKTPEYNPHLVDFKLSRLRGTPLGCRRIHSLMSFGGDLCEFENFSGYPHPLLHIDGWSDEGGGNHKSQNITNLSDALENLKISMEQVLKFMPRS